MLPWQIWSCIQAANVMSSAVPFTHCRKCLQPVLAFSTNMHMSTPTLTGGLQLAHPDISTNKNKACWLLNSLVLTRTKHVGRSTVSMTLVWRLCMGQMCSSGSMCAGKRAQVQLCSGSPRTAADHLPDGSVDAVVSTYVLDILSEQDIEAVLCLADRCTYSLTVTRIFFV